MGINDLWKMVGSAAETRSLLHVATIDGFKPDNRGLRTLIIGVDISIRINAIITALQAANVFNPGLAGQILVLEKLFYQLCQWSLAALTLVFIFDGPGRPSFKRAMITAFGYHYYDAPGEAEAELAQLNRNGEIDGIITEDSDALVFGAKCVIRATSSCVEDAALVFTSEAIERAMSLDEGGLLLCALVLGGDYDDGLKGAGPMVAHGLANAGFGGDLINILRSLKGSQLRDHLNAWRVKLRQELRTNSSGKLSKRQPKLAESIPDTFPNTRVAELYLNPLTSRSVGFAGAKPNVRFWLPAEPSIPALSTFCSAEFGWRGEHLLQKFNSNLWPAVVFRMISSRYILHDVTGNRFLSRSTKADLLKKIPSKSNPALELYRVRVSTNNFVQLASLNHLPPTPERDIKLVSIPKAILAVAMRDLSLPSTDLARVPPFTSNSDSNVNSDQMSDASDTEIVDDMVDTEFEERAVGRAYRGMITEGIIDLTWDF
ncbi:PIN domain-like protein [Mycena metata]|uniref:PIN domain-like protein n=1 Tax=Mycena metata TaxID=1033252 RepID=A0AAD7J6C0_9AGAR|nr:PIN domain-like protein [Mycena metata]